MDPSSSGIEDSLLGGDSSTVGGVSLSGSQFVLPSHRYVGQVGDYELVDDLNNPQYVTIHPPKKRTNNAASRPIPQSPSTSTPDLLYNHHHLLQQQQHLQTEDTPPPHQHPINQNGLPTVFPQYDAGDGNLNENDECGDLDLDLERQQAMFFSSDLLNSGSAMTEGTTSLDETLSNVGSADHLIHGGHANFLSVNHASSFLQGRSLNLHDSFKIENSGTSS